MNAPDASVDTNQSESRRITLSERMEIAAQIESTYRLVEELCAKLRTLEEHHGCPEHWLWHAGELAASTLHHSCAIWDNDDPEVRAYLEGLPAAASVADDNGYIAWTRPHFTRLIEHVRECEAWTKRNDDVVWPEHVLAFVRVLTDGDFDQLLQEKIRYVREGV